MCQGMRVLCYSCSFVKRIFCKDKCRHCRVLSGDLYDRIKTMPTDKTKVEVFNSFTKSKSEDKAQAVTLP